MSEANVFSFIPTKILVPVDFSSSSHSALEAAADLAARFPSEIHLVHVIPTFSTMHPPDLLPETKFMDEVTRIAERQFKACQTDLAEKGIKASYSIESGDDAARIILDVATREHADMVVISTHGISGWFPVVFGSVAEKIVRLAKCPVLLLHTPKPENEATAPSGHKSKWW
jgi:nucleotide-binding universal stress UspA family protein